MYYLNEDGKRVYTLKVRRDYYYRAFVCLFLSFVVRWGRRVALFVVISLSLARVVGPEEDCVVGFFFGLEFFDIILSLSSTIFCLLCECRRRMMMRFAENRAGWETNSERAPGSIQPGRQIFQTKNRV